MYSVSVCQEAFILKVLRVRLSAQRQLTRNFLGRIFSARAIPGAAIGSKACGPTLPLEPLEVGEEGRTDSHRSNSEILETSFP